MRQSREVTTFLSLPAALRERIYAEVLISLEQGPEILRSCRQVEREARKFLYQRPVNFPTQLSLYEWLGATPDNLLAQVIDISVAVQDINLRSILHPHASTLLSPGPPRLLTWDLYEAEVSRFTLALERLPHVKTIAIQASSNSPSHLYDEFVSKILIESRSKLPDARVVHVVNLGSRNTVEY